MSAATVFEVEVPASSLALRDTFEREPGAEFRMEQMVGGGGDRIMPFVWVSGIDADRAEELFAADSSVTKTTRLGGNGDATLFEVTFAGEICSFAETIFERDGVMLHAKGKDSVWSFRLRFTNHQDLGSVFDDEFCRQYEATVTRLYSDQDGPATRNGLTSKQQQALSAAHEMGYYTVPRNVDLRAVGDRLGVSRQAVSERLRRAHESLIGDHLGESELGN
ncbi:helix-turn-helix domain-containing protein [Halorussus halophilus]|uniref:helix-turn-helix domain-containing protein n=1 Tax=Halorussus halophilus TaxID=2650975 RepID=UPI001300D45F|nr:helix-turn-helix domain-containing protein [Halorussus halophilus]